MASVAASSICRDDTHLLLLLVDEWRVCERIQCLQFDDLKTQVALMRHFPRPLAPACACPSTARVESGRGDPKECLSTHTASPQTAMDPAPSTISCNVQEKSSFRAWPVACTPHVVVMSSNHPIIHSIPPPAEPFRPLTVSWLSARGSMCMHGHRNPRCIRKRLSRLPLETLPYVRVRVRVRVRLRLRPGESPKEAECDYWTARIKMLRSSLRLRPDSPGSPVLTSCTPP